MAFVLGQGLWEMDPDGENLLGGSQRSSHELQRLLCLCHSGGCRSCGLLAFHSQHPLGLSPGIFLTPGIRVPEPRWRARPRLCPEGTRPSLSNSQKLFHRSFPSPSQMPASIPQSSLRMLSNQPGLIKHYKTSLKARAPCKRGKVCEKKRGGCGEKTKRGVSGLGGEKPTPPPRQRCILGEESRTGLGWEGP